MVTANIIIDQTGVPFPPDYNPGDSRDNLVLNIAVTLSNEDNTGVVAWNWRLLSKPVGSIAGLTAPTTVATCMFTPDVAGSYLIQLLLNGRVRATVIAAVKTTYLGLRIPAVGETVELGGWERATQTVIGQLEGGFANFAGDLSALETSVSALEISVSALEISVNDLETSDGQALHRDVTSEIYMLDEKLLPEATDVLLIEDSTDGAIKKYIQIGNLPRGSDRTLVFSDDTELGESSGTFVTKKTFRIVRDSDLPPTAWRIVVSLKTSGGGSEIAECQFLIGTDQTFSDPSLFDTSDTLAHNTSTETVMATTLMITDKEPEDELLYAAIQLQLSGSGTTVYIQYTDIFAIY